MKLEDSELGPSRPCVSWLKVPKPSYLIDFLQQMLDGMQPTELDVIDLWSLRLTVDCIRIRGMGGSVSVVSSLSCLSVTGRSPDVLEKQIVA